MSEGIVIALISLGGAVITGILTLMGVVSSNSKNRAITDTKLEELTREVREHNNFARRMPVVEEQIKHLSKRIDEIEDRK
jgi:hypothetical protein